jgi:hypothetical protein
MKNFFAQPILFTTKEYIFFFYETPHHLYLGFSEIDHSNFFSTTNTQDGVWNTR